MRMTELLANLDAVLRFEFSGSAFMNPGVNTVRWAAGLDRDRLLVAVEHGRQWRSLDHRPAMLKLVPVAAWGHRDVRLVANLREAGSGDPVVGCKPYHGHCPNLLVEGRAGNAERGKVQGLCPERSAIRRSCSGKAGRCYPGTCPPSSFLSMAPASRTSPAGQIAGHRMASLRAFVLRYRWITGLLSRP